ncbi:hypothetical protein ICL81_08720 [Leucobacter sp. cx-328]|uniref:DUF3488 domain-containing protein n=1 Tax=unclassified Leucobacter TaxID=2621730 RepID=UPI00165DDCEE|nr:MULTISPECIES: transglutaminase domain-containing protein [unclassified Leucobacter]MBC9944587.1 hypothetical protein [Leucobacter sp. cx-328]
MNRDTSRIAWRRLPGALAAAAIALVLGGLGAWQIYETPWLFAVAGASFVLATLISTMQARFRWSWPVYIAVAALTFVVTLVPVARPQSFSQGLLPGFLDSVSAIVLGWKQLLTLTLPVGWYQSVLVPAYLVFFVSTLAIVRIGLRSSNIAGFAVVPMLAPLAFATVFGSSAVSAPLRFCAITIVAPREIALWLLGAIAAALWIVWVTGADRRAALRLGRQQVGVSAPRDVAADTGASLRSIRGGRGGRGMRFVTGAVTLLVAFGLAAVAVHAVDAGSRSVARDEVAPVVVIREQASALATYRASKSDTGIDAPLFSVEAVDKGAVLPDRLRIAVLDDYNGVDFHVGEGEAGRFSRFPSGRAGADDPVVQVRIAEAYDGIWLPTAGFTEPPWFIGSRGAELADSLYVNRDTGAAIAVPNASGVQPGDGFTAPMRRTTDTKISDLPAQRTPLVDLETMPELATWIERQQQSVSAEGLTELIDRLRARGYLSHALAPGESGTSGEHSKWLTRLAEEYGTTFKPSLGGHSASRIESLFAELNAQELAAGENPDPAALVAGVGDDEQFAAAGALIARALGYESRVVVGVHLTEPDFPGIPACDTICTGENIAAWIEVRGSDGKWAAVDVTPQLSLLPQLIEQGEQLPEFPTIAEQRDAQEVDPPIGTTDQHESGDPRVDDTTVSWLIPLAKGVGLAVGGLACIALPLVFLPLAKRRRASRRKREPNPELRALGAWAELLDRERDAGYEIDESRTRPRIAAEIGHPAVVWAAMQVDRAVFSPEGIDGDTADWVWNAVETHAADRRQNLTKREKLREAFAMRSLWPLGGRGTAQWRIKTQRSSQRKAG